VITSLLPCACHCGRSVRAAYSPAGLLTVTEDGWLLRSVQRGDRQLEIRAWRRECTRSRSQDS
jgi:hypothetical protein